MDCQRNRRTSVLVVIQGEGVKSVDSYKYLRGQINKKKKKGRKGQIRLFLRRLRLFTVSKQIF